ncbi:MAG: sugar kinase [Xenococcaceae cyanobacterium]
MSTNFQGLFIGLTTLDLIYLTTRLPRNNEKIVALQQTIAAGGPATNAAVTFNCLGSKAKLLSIIGKHPLSNLIQSDLEEYAVESSDLEADKSQSPPVSSIFVTESTGERAVVSINATKSQARLVQIPKDVLSGINIVLIDGHQLEISCAIAQQAQAQNIPLVLDGGSWKPGLELVLPFIDYAICSADFFPPNCHKQKDIFNYLKAQQIPHIAITNGAKNIQYTSKNKQGTVAINRVKVVDTLGAGDIFHGAFCHYILQQDFIKALDSAAKVASFSCQHFGTRQIHRFLKKD